MGYSTMAHALISYIESYIKDFDIKEMSKSFGFSEIYIRELFLKNIYTRAFRKVFGMSPNEFRLNRCLIV